MTQPLERSTISMELVDEPVPKRDVLAAVRGAAKAGLIELVRVARSAPHGTVYALVPLPDPDTAAQEVDDLTQLRTPAATDAATLGTLRVEALRQQEQRRQIAAMTGLCTIGGPQAVLVLVERLTHSWGGGALKKAITCLAKLAPAGGLLGLTAGLLSDSRFLHEKGQALAKGLAQLGDAAGTQAMLDLWATYAGSEYDLALSQIVAQLCQWPTPDIAHGAVLATSTLGVERLPWARSIASPTDAALIAACAYAEARLPGLIELMTSVRTSPSW